MLSRLDNVLFDKHTSHRFRLDFGLKSSNEDSQAPNYVAYTHRVGGPSVVGLSQAIKVCNFVILLLPFYTLCILSHENVRGGAALCAN